MIDFLAVKYDLVVFDEVKCPKFRMPRFGKVSLWNPEKEQSIVLENGLHTLPYKCYYSSRQNYVLTVHHSTPTGAAL